MARGRATPPRWCTSSSSITSPRRRHPSRPAAARKTASHDLHRDVTLVLCLRDGSLLGALPPVRVDVPWWQEVGPVVDAAQAAYGLDVTILRLLAGKPRHAPGGGPVTYLAEVAAVPSAPLEPWAGDPLAPDPLRLPYAEPGGPAADLAWADTVLDERGTPRSGAARQVRTWNLSSLWRLPVGRSAAWLKVVPPFFAHEPLMLSLLDREAVPPLLAADGRRMLLDEVPGVDHYDTERAPLLEMIRLLVRLQVDWVGRVAELLACGLPDWRLESLDQPAADVVARTAPELDPTVVSRLHRLVAALPRLGAEVEACGISATLVHGDFHPANLRGMDDRLVLLDWGDCGVGHPLLDQAAFLDRVPGSEQSLVRDEWSRLWREAVPGSEPGRAALLLKPVAALRQALIYRGFLDAIEPDERIYHAADPAIWLVRAAESTDALDRSE